MIYTGIPVVSLPDISFDTVNSIVRLEWDAVPYHNLKDYIIYKKEASDAVWYDVFIGTTTETEYVDTIDLVECNKYVENDERCTNEIQYRVIARSKTDENGDPHYVVSVTVVAPSILLPFADAGNDTILSIGSTTVLDGIRSRSLFEEITEHVWDIGNTGEFTVSSTGTVTVNAPEEYNDTALCILRVTAASGALSYDTVAVISSSFQSAAAELPVNPLRIVVFHDTLWAVGASSSGGPRNASGTTPWTGCT